MSRLTQFLRPGLVFDVRDGGPPDGEPIVLLHGFPQDSTSWDAVSTGLHTAGLRTLAPDLRGYSPGARPPGRRAYAISQSADDLLALLDAAGLTSAHLVGHDWGGALAWYVAGRNPQRVRTLTVLSTPHPAAMRRAWYTSTQGLKSWYMVFFQLPLLPELYISANPVRIARSLQGTGLPPERAEYYAGRLAMPGAARAALGWYRAIPFTLREPFGPVVVPTSYVWGKTDPFLGRAAAEATAGYVAGDYRLIESDAGHWLPETHRTKRSRPFSNRCGGHDVEDVAVIMETIAPYSFSPMNWQGQPARWTGMEVSPALRRNLMRPGLRPVRPRLFSLDVLANELGHDLVLLLGLDLLGLGVLLGRIGSLGVEDEGAVLKKLLLPEVKERRLDAMLLADVGDERRARSDWNNKNDQGSANVGYGIVEVVPEPMMDAAMLER